MKSQFIWRTLNKFSTLVNAPHSSILIIRVSKIFSNNKLSLELKLIKNFSFLNEFPKYIVNSIFLEIFRHAKIKVSLILKKTKKNLLKLTFFRYYGDKWFLLIKSYIVKTKYIEKWPTMRCYMTFVKWSFPQAKDRTPIINQYFTVCEIKCPSFGENYVGKTDKKNIWTMC